MRHLVMLRFDKSSEASYFSWLKFKSGLKDWFDLIVYSLVSVCLFVNGVGDEMCVEDLKL